MRKKTATVAQALSSTPTSETKPTAASVLAEPSVKRQPVSVDAIRVCAYKKWEAAGKPASDGVTFWLEAEQELSHTK